MAGTDVRMDDGEGGAAAVTTPTPGPDIPEPLRSLVQRGTNDDPQAVHLHGKSSLALCKVPQPYRPFVFGSSKSVSPDAAYDAYHQSGAGGGGGTSRKAGTNHLRMASTHRSQPHPGAAEDHHQHHALSEYSEIQNCMDDTGSTPRSPMSMSEGSQSYGPSCFSDSQLITDVEDNENLMQLKLEAMTWAAMAKDFTISSLEKRLRKALQIAKAEQAKNHELQYQLGNSRLELSKAKEDIAKLEEAEERLCRERGDIEVDATKFAAERAKFAVEQARQHRSQLVLLEHRIKLMLGDKTKPGKDRYLERSLTQDWQSSDVQILEQALDKAEEKERVLNEKVQESEQEIEDLRRELSDANNDRRVSEVLRKTQARRLKALEKERRYLLRKGALRSVKLAPRTQRRYEPTLPGGPGWNVFSVLGYEES